MSSFNTYSYDIICWLSFSKTHLKNKKKYNPFFINLGFHSKIIMLMVRNSIRINKYMEHNLVDVTRFKSTLQSKIGYCNGSPFKFGLNNTMTIIRYSYKLTLAINTISLCLDTCKQVGMKGENLKYRSR